LTRVNERIFSCWNDVISFINKLFMKLKKIKSLVFHLLLCECANKLQVRKSIPFFICCWQIKTHLYAAWFWKAVPHRLFKPKLSQTLKSYTKTKPKSRNWEFQLDPSKFAGDTLVQHLLYAHSWIRHLRQDFYTSPYYVINACRNFLSNE
jgi:hypothetical protein